jgi:hypothetical protein
MNSRSKRPVKRAMTAEEKRLQEDRARKANWKRWGPYLSERQWGTVREDYSASGAAWDYFPHDHARSRAYRWGEDGLLGLHQLSQEKYSFAPSQLSANDSLAGWLLIGSSLTCRLGARRRMASFVVQPRC